MQIAIKDCNNIAEGTIQITKNKLNIKYGINGTGKSTVAKAIAHAVSDRINGTALLSELRPFTAVNGKAIKRNRSEVNEELGIVGVLGR